MNSLEGTKNGNENINGEISPRSTLTGGVNMGASFYKGIDTVTQTTTSEADNGINVVTMTLTDGTKSNFVIHNGSKGSQGVGIESVKQTVVSDADDGDNYVMLELTDGREYAFKVQNGSKGSKGDKGDKGNDGASIIGIMPTKISTISGDNNEYSLVLSDGTLLEFNVYNGKQGEKGDKGAKGDKGDKGDNGSDASVTTANIKSALGYTPANAQDITTHTNDGIVHVTQEEKNAWNNKSNFSGSYNDLTDKPDIAEIEWDDINDKPFYEVTRTDTLVWDGNTEGLPIFDMMGDGSYTYYLISETVPTLEDVSNGVTIDITSPDGNYVDRLTLNDFMKAGDVLVSNSTSNLIFALTDTASLYGRTVPKKGVYVLSTARYGHVSRIVIPDYEGFNTQIQALRMECLADVVVTTDHLEEVFEEYVTEVSELSKQIADVSVFATPQMFGAKGDGTTDDTVAMQNAFNHVATSGGYLFIPKGRYKVTSPITIDWSSTSTTKRNFLQKIIGAGSQAFEKQYDNSVIVGYNIPANRGVIELIGNGNTWGTETRIEDLGIECDEATCDTMSFALKYGDARNFKLSRVKLRGHNGILARCGSIVDGNGNSTTKGYEQMDIKFEQCDIYTFPNSTKGFAFLPEGVVTGHYAVMDNIVVDSCLINGVWVVNSVNVLFQSCHIAINNVANKQITTNNVGLLNGYEIDYATGFYVAQAMSCVFQNCYFEDYRRGIQITPTIGNIRNVSIMNCYLNPGCNQYNSDGSRLCSDYGIRINSGMSGKVVRNVVVENNVFRLVEGDTEFAIANVSNEFANRFVFKGNCTTSTQVVPKVVNTTTEGYDICNDVNEGIGIKNIEVTEDEETKNLTIHQTNGKSFAFSVDKIDGITDETMAEIENYVVSEVAKRSQLQPEFANSVDGCVDKTKMYVLPDGYIYAFMKTVTESTVSYTNKLPTSTTTDRKTVYNGKGYKNSTRLSSSSGGESSSSEQMCVSGFISAKAGDVIRIKGTSPVAGVSSYIMGFNSSNAKTGAITLQNGDGTHWDADPSGLYTYDVESDTITATLSSSAIGSNFNAVRISGHIDSNTIVTINEEIKTGTTTVVTESWKNTGHAFVPANYENRIVELESIVADLQTRLK